MNESLLSFTTASVRSIHLGTSILLKILIIMHRTSSHSYSSHNGFQMVTKGNAIHTCSIRDSNMHIISSAYLSSKQITERADTHKPPSLLGNFNYSHSRTAFDSLN